MESIVPYLIVPVWALATMALWRGNHRRWDLSVADFVTVSVFMLIGVVLIGLALAPSPAVY